MDIVEPLHIFRRRSSPSGEQPRPLISTLLSMPAWDRSRITPPRNLTSRDDTGTHVRGPPPSVPLPSLSPSPLSFPSLLFAFPTHCPWGNLLSICPAILEQLEKGKRLGPGDDREHTLGTTIYGHTQMPGYTRDVKIGNGWYSRQS